MNRIAIIVNDPDKRLALTEWVEDLGYRACAFGSGILAEQALRRRNIALVICDFMSRNVDGLAVLRAARASGEIPFLILSDSLDEVELVLSLKAGADQAMAWPLPRSVLTVAIEAMLERYDRLIGTGLLDNRTIEAGHLSLDPDCRTARWRGREVGLTAHEFEILRRLAHRPGRVRSREQLIGEEAAGAVPERTIDSHIKRIRKKFRQVDPGFEQIVTIYGLGYRFDAEDDAGTMVPVEAVSRSRSAGRVALLAPVAAAAPL
jgi:two-component system response regulator ChvI